MGNPESALIVASGAPQRAVESAPPADLVIAADDGLDVLAKARRDVDVVVGDLDSVDDQVLNKAIDNGTEILRYQPDKDESDLELALALAVSRDIQRILVILRDGGRLDHQLANLLVLASPRWGAAEVDALVGDHRVWVVHRQRTIPLKANEPLALHALGQSATDVTTTNLKYPLTNAELPALVALGISNQVIADSPTISVGSGVVLAISSA